MKTNHSLPRLALLVSLFWLLRYVVAPASRFALALLCVVFFVALSPFVLLAYGYSEGAKLRYENA